MKNLARIKSFPLVILAYNGAWLFLIIQNRIENVVVERMTIILS